MAESKLKTDCNVYSENEQIVGIWIDGKPIYRKVLKTSQTGSSTFDFGDVTGIDRLLKAEMCLMGNSGNNQEATYTYYYFVRDTKVNTSENIHRFQVFTNGTSYELYGMQYLIIEYTKTTD